MKTLVILKPDTLKRKLVGEIILRIERKNFCIERMELRQLDKKLVEEHYSHLAKLTCFEDIINFMISGPSILMIISGNDVISEVRKIVGKTNFTEALPGTIRGDYGCSTMENLIHASDSSENADIEIKRFFNQFF